MDFVFLQHLTMIRPSYNYCSDLAEYSLPEVEHICTSFHTVFIKVHKPDAHCE